MRMFRGEGAATLLTLALLSYLLPQIATTPRDDNNNMERLLFSLTAQEKQFLANIPNSLRLHPFSPILHALQNDKSSSLWWACTATSHFALVCASNALLPTADASLFVAGWIEPSSRRTPSLQSQQEPLCHCADHLVLSSFVDISYPSEHRTNYMKRPGDEATNIVGDAAQRHRTNTTDQSILAV
ncbi:hypothetical protein IWZ00DRAFT_153699 [Phyllosticta capitalensis]|uniref:Uncharacterized protein n=1 Tax=Phyllosticta capitalensis TaxID=121624 RepID=A0ABR1Z016_9PEZI